MVSDDRKRMLSSLQPVPPFFQGKFDGEQLSITNIIVPLCWGKLPGEVSARVESGRLSRGGIEIALLPRRWWRHPLQR